MSTPPPGAPNPPPVPRPRPAVPRPVSKNPFSTAWSPIAVFLAGAAYGLGMRLLFGLHGTFDSGPGGSAIGVMMAAFAVLVPLLIGALTVYLSGERRRHFAYCIVAPVLPVVAFVMGAAVLLIEGSICIVMALPLFGLLGMLGGVAMWAVLKWKTPSPSAMGAVLVLPLLLGVWERGQPMPDRVQVATDSVLIAAKPEVIWGLVNHAMDIRPDEMRDGLAYRIGVPFPQSADTVRPGVGGIRKLRWDKGVQFDEPITAWQPNRYIRWDYRFTPDSFPAGAMDEHVVIGGRYFDLQDTSYTLTPEAGGTRLAIRVTYRVSTNFNWYAGPAGELLVDDAAGTILAFYKKRAEAGGSAVAATAAGSR